jgi:hypothetical protein
MQGVLVDLFAVVLNTVGLPGVGMKKRERTIAVTLPFGVGGLPYSASSAISMSIAARIAAEAELQPDRRLAYSNCAGVS